MVYPSVLGPSRVQADSFDSRPCLVFVFDRLILEVQTYVEQLGEECTVNLVVPG